MNARRRYAVNVLATGVLATILTLTALFWARYVCSQWHTGLIAPYLYEAAIRPALSALDRVPDANLVARLAIVARTSITDSPWIGLGVTQYLFSRMPGPEAMSDSYIYRWERGPDAQATYYDRTLGLMVRTGMRTTTKPDGSHVDVPVTDYAGPEGIGSAPEERLGRFVDPIADWFTLEPWVVCDRGSGRFFVIDWQKRTVRQGTSTFQTEAFRPVQIGWIRKNPILLRIEFNSPTSRDSSGQPLSDPAFTSGLGLHQDFRLVLDVSGRIDTLDMNTLELSAGPMKLMVPPGLFSREHMGTPEDVAAYSVEPCFMHSLDRPGTWEHIGTAVATLGRGGMTARLAVFEPNGTPVGADRNSRMQFPSAEHAYFDLPGAGTVTIARFLVESLHPPALLFLSYFTGPRSEATAGSRSLFVPADSFLAMKGMDDRRTLGEGFLVLLLMLPALFVSGLLARRVSRDAVRFGLTRRARKMWAAGTFFLGLPIYVTYCLTRPKVALVTCANCGLGRRPDFEKCHHCGSLWAVPELIPPAWRVLGEAEQMEQGSPSPAKEMESPAEGL